MEEVWVYVNEGIPIVYKKEKDAKKELRKMGFTYRRSLNCWRYKEFLSDDTEAMEFDIFLERCPIR